MRLVLRCISISPFTFTCLHRWAVLCSSAPGKHLKTPRSERSRPSFCNRNKNNHLEIQPPNLKSHIFPRINSPTLASQCRQWTPAASHPVSLEAAETPGQRWWPRSRWWPGQDESTRPRAAGWAAPPILPDGSWSCCSPKRFVWWDRRLTTNFMNESFKVWWSSMASLSSLLKRKRHWWNRFYTCSSFLPHSLSPGSYRWPSEMQGEV